MRSVHVSEVVRRTPEEVYAYARDAEHLPRWAAGIATQEVRMDGETLVVESPMGRIRVRFEPENSYGVLDHVVDLPDGTSQLNPMRVVAHPDGAEVLFTVRQHDLTDEQLDADVAAVTADLATLRRILETPEV